MPSQQVHEIRFSKNKFYETEHHVFSKLAWFLFFYNNSFDFCILSKY